MKTGSNKAIIYDDQCPMCVAYTSGFVKWGILKKENRVSFSTLHQKGFITQLDAERSRREIPLVDLDGGKTLYGVDALLYLLSRRIPFIQAVGKFKPVYWFVNRLYRLISYNRRVIVGSRFAETQIDCAPDYNLKYRLVFIVFAALAAIGITALFGKAMAGVYPETTKNPVINMLLICGTGWILHGLIAGLVLRGKRRVEYFGQLGVLQLIGVFPLLLVLFGSSAESRVVLAAVAVATSSALMGWQHYRRMKNNDYATGWSICWAVCLYGSALLVLFLLY